MYELSESEDETLEDDSSNKLNETVIETDNLNKATVNAEDQEPTGASWVDMVDNQTNHMPDEKKPGEEGKPTKPKEDVEIPSIIVSVAEEET